jgi:hypothetical protein
MNRKWTLKNNDVDIPHVIVYGLSQSDALILANDVKRAIRISKKLSEMLNDNALEKLYGSYFDPSYRKCVSEGFSV